jgi:mono/diheme cytochrome c family protein
MQKVFDKVVDAQVEALEKSRAFVVKHEKRQPTRVWIGLGALLGATLAGVVAGYLLRDFGKRNIEYIPDMAYSKAWESQQPHHYPEWEDRDALPNPLFNWGTADMAPPDGTVYRGQVALDIPAGPEGLEQAKTMRNPYAGSSGAERDEVLARGKRLFTMNCQGCHGVDGIGDAPVTKYGVGAPAINGQLRTPLTDGQIFHIITYGYNTMPAHASHVEYDDRWKVITYLRHLQEGNRP